MNCNANELLRKSNIKKLIIITVVIANILAYGYRVMNLNFSHDSLMIFQEGIRLQISLGRFFQPIMILIRGRINSPYLIFIVSTFYMILTCFLLVDLLDIKDRICVIIICIALSINSAMVCAYATYINWSDLFSLAMLSSVLSVWLCEKGGKFWLLSVLAIILTLGLYQAYIQVSLLLFILCVIVMLQRDEDKKVIFNKVIKMLIVLVVGATIYLLITVVNKKVLKIELAETYNGIAHLWEFSGTNILNLILNAYKNFFELYCIPKTYAPILIGIINALLLIYIIVRTAVVCKPLKNSRKIMVLVLIALIPMAMNASYIMSKGTVNHSLTHTAQFVLYVWVSVLIQNQYQNGDTSTVKTKCYLNNIIVITIAIVFWCGAVYANQAYIKKGLQEKATISKMSRIVYAIENTDNYVPGVTPVKFVGSLEESPLISEPKGFGELDDTGLDVRASVTYGGTIKWFCSYYLNENINYYSGEIDELQLKDIPVFPAKDSLQYIDDVLVVKLSE